MGGKKENDSGKSSEPDFLSFFLRDALSEAASQIGKKRTMNKMQPKDAETLPEAEAPALSATIPEPVDKSVPVPVMVPVTDSVRPGETLLGIYRIDSDPVQGGMGRVWRVHHTGWNVDLAMKRPKPEFFKSERDKRNFTEECRSWINLGLHPNVVSCYYVREIDGVPTIFSEWMDGGSVEKKILDGSLYEVKESYGRKESYEEKQSYGRKEPYEEKQSYGGKEPYEEKQSYKGKEGEERKGSEKASDAELQRKLLDLAIQFARGLRYAHDNGLIHQDVKPDNLLLTKNGEAKVTDFGLAKARSFMNILPEEKRSGGKRAEKNAKNRGKKSGKNSEKNSGGESVEKSSEKNSGGKSPEKSNEKNSGGKSSERSAAAGISAQTDIAAEFVLHANMTQAAPAGGRTPSYCSPEQASGFPLTRRTDIYSWAVSVMEMYLGSKPWARGRELTGPIAGAACREYFAMCPPERRIPERLQELLARCMEADPDQRPHDFSLIEEELLDIYTEVTGQKYPRPAPGAAGDTADSLNNRALSMLDIGEPEEAEKLWEEALQKDAHHVDARFNRELYLLRSNRKYDFEVIEELERYKEIKKSGAVEAVVREHPGTADKPEAFLAGGDTRSKAIFLHTAALGGEQMLITGTIQSLPGIGRFSKDGKAEDLEWDDLQSLTVSGEMVPGQDVPGQNAPRQNDSRKNAPVQNDFGQNAPGQNVSGQNKTGKNAPGRKWKPENVEYAEYLPDGSLAVLIMKDYTAGLYDPMTKQMLAVSEKIKDLRYVKKCFFHPGKTCMAAVFADQVFVFSLPELVLTAHLKKTECIGFLPDGRCLLRRKITRMKEALFLADLGSCKAPEQEPEMEEVYRFERVLEKSYEYLREENVFLVYTFKNTKEAFFLDRTFTIRPLPERIFEKMGSVLFYEARTGLLCTGYSGRMYFWEACTGRFLYSVKPAGITSGTRYYDRAVFDKEKRRIILWVKYNYAVFQPLSLPAMPYASLPAEWRLSRVITARERLEQEDRLSLFRRQFKACADRGDVPGMIRIHEDCLRIPGFPGSGTAWRMENVLESVAQRGQLCGIYFSEHLAEEGNSLQADQRKVLFSQNPVPLGRDLAAAFSEEDLSAGVSIYDREGRLVRTIKIPETAKKIFVRDGRILAFGKKMDVAVYDSEGNPLDPGKTAPEEYDPPDYHNKHKYGSPFLLKPDKSGSCILYAVDHPFGPDRKKQERGVFQKDLRTGEVIRIMDRYHENAVPWYLKDGSILVPPLPAEHVPGYDPGVDDPDFCLRRLSARDGHVIREYWIRMGRKMYSSDKCSVRFNQDHSLFLVESYYPYRYHYSLFGLEEGLIFTWGEEMTAPFFLPGRRYLCYQMNDKKNILHFFDILKKEDVYQLPLHGGIFLPPVPDGRELWMLEKTSEGDRLTRFRITYSYEFMNEPV